MRYRLPISPRLWSTLMHPVKVGAGMMFDLTKGNYRVGELEFVVPRGMTSRRDRAQFMVDTYEGEERLFIGRHLPADATVLELGACIGVLSCVINAKLADRTRQVSVEANPRLMRYLEANRALNGARFAIEARVVSNRPSETFFFGDAIVSGSMHRKGAQAIEVATSTVEGLEAEHAMVFDALVIDIEGAEATFFAENAPFLARLRFCLVELHPQIIGAEAVESCREALRRAGLRRVDQAYLSEVWVRDGAAAR